MHFFFRYILWFFFTHKTTNTAIKPAGISSNRKKTINNTKYVFLVFRYFASAVQDVDFTTQFIIYIDRIYIKVTTDHSAKNNMIQIRLTRNGTAKHKLTSIQILPNYIIIGNIQACRSGRKSWNTFVYLRNIAQNKIFTNLMSLILKCRKNKQHPCDFQELLRI